jgi:hypothetical protein
MLRLENVLGDRHYEPPGPARAPFQEEKCQTQRREHSRTPGRVRGKLNSGGLAMGSGDMRGCSSKKKPLCPRNPGNLPMTF